MPAPISINDDIGSNSIETAFDRLDRAHRALLRLILKLDDGAGPSDFPGLNLEAHIRRTLGEMHTARYEADAAMCSLMRGEPFQLRPTQPVQGQEMLARAYRNERRNGRPLPDSAMPATVSVGGL